MHIDFNVLLQRLPPKERVYCGVTLLLGLWLVLNTPTSAPDAASIRTRAIAAGRRDFGEEQVRGFLDKAASPDRGPRATADDLVERAATRVRMPASVVPSRDVTMRADEASWPLQLEEIDFPPLAELPDYEPPALTAPELRFHDRPRPRDRRVPRLVNDDGVPYDFEDTPHGR